MEGGDNMAAYSCYGASTGILQDSGAETVSIPGGSLVYYGGPSDSSAKKLEPKREESELCLATKHLWI